ncbi:MAG TPA: tetratricopeptide repeat protein, partial [Clostridia bacterium]|nr:tetratricopeptide repeat protein [Clostridia bacterium]
QLAAQTNAVNEQIARGYLLLGEAQLVQGAAIAAEKALQPVTDVQLNPDLAWQRQYLLCRVLLAQGRVENSLQGTTNLLALAGSGNREMQAESVAFQASLFERLGRADEAIAAYQKNLADGLPAERQRKALLKITELYLAQKRLADAAQVLEKFLVRYPKADAADQALLTLGELRIRQQTEGICANVNSVLFTNAPVQTNCLELALSSLQMLTNKFPQSALLGKAQLDLGWCYWLSGRIAESRVAFQEAVARLSKSSDQATAYLKLADAEFSLGNHSAAISNYNAILEKFAEDAEVKSRLFESALYQIVQVGAKAGDLAAATNALAKILTWYPNSLNASRALLIAGQEVARRDAAGARVLFLDFVKNSPNAPLLPEVELAIARTHEQQNQWGEALRKYEAWLGSFTNHPSQARAEYCRARANSLAGNQTNAFVQFTNFVARFPKNEFAPLAQWWIADYFYNAGNYEAAEINYSTIYLNTNNWNSFPLFYEARMMAGRAAYQRQAWDQASGHFKTLANDTNRTDSLRAQAYFAYGDTLISQDSTNKLADFREALRVFDYIANYYTNTPQAVLAWGAKAKCLLQLAQGEQDYLSVSNSFQQVIGSPAADTTARSIAQVGMGLTLEKLADQTSGAAKAAILENALTNYTAVFYAKLLRDGETPDDFWRKKAGLDAARLLSEKLNRRAEAINIYRRLQDLFPFLKLEDKINGLRTQEQLNQQKS